MDLNANPETYIEEENGVLIVTDHAEMALCFGATIATDESRLSPAFPRMPLANIPAMPVLAALLAPAPFTIPFPFARMAIDLRMERNRRVGMWWVIGAIGIARPLRHSGHRQHN